MACKEIIVGRWKTRLEYNYIQELIYTPLFRSWRIREKAFLPNGIQVYDKPLKKGELQTFLTCPILIQEVSGEGITGFKPVKYRGQRLLDGRYLPDEVVVVLLIKELKLN